MIIQLYYIYDNGKQQGQQQQQQEGSSKMRSISGCVHSKWIVDHMMVVMVLMVVVSLSYTTSAFQIIENMRPRRSESSLLLFSSRSSLDNDVPSFITRVKKSGGGIPAGIPPGNNSVFDPSKEGKIGDTYDRINTVKILLSSKSASSALSIIDRIKKVGGGISLSIPGNNCIFDPSVEGKLFGTSSLNDRTKYGASYTY